MSVTEELLGHFAGYLRLNEEAALSRDQLDGSPQGRKNQEDTPNAAPDSAVRIEELQSSGSTASFYASVQSVTADIPHSSLATGSALQQSARGGRVAPQNIKSNPGEGAGSNGGASGGFHRDPTFHEHMREGGDDLLAEITQINMLQDGDVYLQGDHEPVPVTDQSALLASSVEAAAEFINQSAELPASGHIPDLLTFVQSRFEEVVAQAQAQDQGGAAFSLTQGQEEPEPTAESALDTSFTTSEVTFTTSGTTSTTSEAISSAQGASTETGKSDSAAIAASPSAQTAAEAIAKAFSAVYGNSPMASTGGASTSSGTSNSSEASPASSAGSVSSPSLATAIATAIGGTMHHGGHASSGASDAVKAHAPASSNDSAVTSSSVGASEMPAASASTAQSPSGVAPASAGTSDVSYAGSVASESVSAAASGQAAAATATDVISTQIGSTVGATAVAEGVSEAIATAANVSPVVDAADTSVTAVSVAHSSPPAEQSGTPPVSDEVSSPSETSAAGAEADPAAAVAIVDAIDAPGVINSVSADEDIGAAIVAITGDDATEADTAESANPSEASAANADVVVPTDSSQTHDALSSGEGEDGAPVVAASDDETVVTEVDSETPDAGASAETAEPQDADSSEEEDGATPVVATSDDDAVVTQVDSGTPDADLVVAADSAEPQEDGGATAVVAASDDDAVITESDSGTSDTDSVVSVDGAEMQDATVSETQDGATLVVTTSDQDVPGAGIGSGSVSSAPGNAIPTTDSGEAVTVAAVTEPAATPSETSTTDSDADAVDAVVGAGTSEADGTTSSEGEFIAPSVVATSEDADDESIVTSTGDATPAENAAASETDTGETTDDGDLSSPDIDDSSDADANEVSEAVSDAVMTAVSTATAEDTQPSAANPATVAESSGEGEASAAEDAETTATMVASSEASEEEAEEQTVAPAGDNAASSAESQSSAHAPATTAAAVEDGAATQSTSSSSTTNSSVDQAPSNEAAPGSGHAGPPADVVVVVSNSSASPGDAVVQSASDAAVSEELSGVWTGQYQSDDGPGPGTYVNGVLQSEDAEQPASPDVSYIPDFPDVGAVELAIQAGSNVAANAATIIDLDGVTFTNIVKGDHFNSNIIVQANVLVDDDTIINLGKLVNPNSHAIEVDTVAPKEQWDTGADFDLLQALARMSNNGEAPEQPDFMSGVSTGDNVTNNIATFDDMELSFKAAAGFVRDLHVTVDKVDGDYFRVHSVTQTNLMSDNDVLVHEKSANYSAVVTGSNDQLNTAFFDDIGLQYDLVIVGGNYYAMNYIQQINVVLDSDWIQGFGGGNTSDNLSVNSGQNSLTNDALISKVGSNEYDAFSSEADSLLGKLESGAATGAYDWSWLAGSASGSLNVLYVTGDYYDISSIFQTNIIIDADSILLGTRDTDKYRAGTANDRNRDRDQRDQERQREREERDQERNKTNVVKDNSHDNNGRDDDQVISSGANVSVNLAQIFDFGSLGSNLIGGAHYDDSLLIQGNFVSNNDKVLDTQTLATEVVAFVSDSSDHGADADHQTFAAQSVSGVGDMLSHFMHH